MKQLKQVEERSKPAVQELDDKVLKRANAGALAQPAVSCDCACVGECAC